MFELIVLLSVFYFLQQPLKPLKVHRPAELREPLRKSLSLFALLAALYASSWLVRQFLPVYGDLLPGLILLLTVFLSKSFRVPEPLSWIAFCVWAYLAPQEPAQAFCKAALISVLAPILQGSVHGLRFRLAFTTTLKSFSALPGLFLLFSLVALACSAYFRPA